MLILQLCQVGVKLSSVSQTDEMGVAMSSSLDNMCSSELGVNACLLLLPNEFYMLSTSVDWKVVTPTA